MKLRGQSRCDYTNRWWKSSKYLGLSGIVPVDNVSSVSFEGKKKRVGSKEKQERDKLQHKLKREMKGAIREIRKDNSFLARQQLKEQIDKWVVQQRVK